MYDFLEEIKERAEVSKRELILGVIVGFLSGVVLGIIFSDLKNKPKKSVKQIIVEPSQKSESILLNPEDYD